MPESYFIKWRFSKGSPRVHASEPFHTSDAAMVSACVLLKFRGCVVWIEGPDGVRIGADEIARNCRALSEEGLSQPVVASPKVA